MSVPMIIKKKLPIGLSGKTTLTILLLVIVLHLFMMVYYLQYNRLARQAERRDAVIQKIINAIYLVEATPVANRRHAVEAMADPVINASFTIKPLWKLQFRKISFWEITRKLHNNLTSFALSIRLDKDQWLNLNATIYSHMLWRQLLLVAIEAFVLGTIFFAVWSVVRFTEPLKQVKTSVERLGNDLESKPIDIYGPSVVREVAQAMNEMQQRIQTLIQDRTQMLAAISHDLRTPITRMKLRIQFIDETSLFNSLHADLDEMEKMINETLSFAREDSANEKKMKIDLVSLLQSICDENNDIGHSVHFQARHHRVPILGRPLALKRAFTNLINNAVRFGKHVDVLIYTKHKNIFVRIADDGPGILEKDLEKVFEPFYRSEYSRNRDTGGVGLGLAVTRDIIVRHNGKIKLKNARQGGLVAQVELCNALGV